MFTNLVLAVLAVGQPQRSDAQPMRHCPGAIQVPVGAPCPSVCPWIVFFDRNSAALTADARSTLEQVAITVIRQPVELMRLTGHSDASEDAALSNARVEAIRDYLVTQGLQAASIETEGLGNRQPSVETPPGQAEPQNRGVYINLID